MNAPNEPTPQEKIPSRIGAYTVKGILGTGGMGQVLLAHDERLDRPVAIKRIKHGLKLTDKAQERFHREARASAQLSHPNIVQVYDIFDFVGGDHIIMEFVSGKTLSKLIKEGPIPENQILDLAIQLADGLVEAHNKGIVHRDFKVENVIVTSEGRAKILDFGLARRLDANEQSLTGRGELMGTARTMSPEQARGEKVDARTDLFSFGILLYELATQVSPFRGRNGLVTMTNIQSSQQIPMTTHRPDISPLLANLVDWLLQKDREKRPVDAAQVLEVLQQIASSSSESKEVSFVGETGSHSDLAMASFSQAPTSAGTDTAPSRFRRLLFPVGLPLAIVVALLVFWMLQPKTPLRVAVLEPQLKGGEQLENAALLVAGIQDAVLEGLFSLKNVTALPPDQVADRSRGLPALARSIAANELLEVTVASGGAGTLLTMRRINGLDGSLLWMSTLDVENVPSRLIAETIMARLHQGFPKFRVKKSWAGSQVRPEDYLAYLSLQVRLGSNLENTESEWQSYQRILDGSPMFLSAVLGAGNAAYRGFVDSSEEHWARRAADLSRRARDVAPDDPRPLLLHISLALRQGNFDQAKRMLDDLAELEPGSVECLEARARLRHKEGDLAGAVALMTRVIAKQPSWANLHFLSNLEIQHGLYSEARLHLEQLLQVAPGNYWGVTKLATLEMMHGDLERAEALFRRATETRQSYSALANLGTVLFLKGKYQAAEEAYLKARDIAPKRAGAWMNLAESYMAQGLGEKAKELYAQALVMYQAHKEKARVLETMSRAQCLAQLNRTEEAVRLTLSTLQANPGNYDVLLQAAIVYALVGDANASYAAAASALEKGLQPRWLAVPAFNVLRNEPRFKNLLAEHEINEI